MRPLEQHTNAVFNKITDSQETNCDGPNREITCHLQQGKAKTYNKFIQVFKDVHEHLLTRGIYQKYIQLDNKSYPEFQK